MTGMGSCQPAGKGKVGEVLVKKENIITFKEGILGFEDLREFVILDIEEWRPFEWLVSVENPDVTFPIVNPTQFFKDYNPVQQIRDVSAIGAKDQKGVEMFCIVTLGKKPEDATVNLKGPIFVNTQNKTGKQYILEGKQYTLNHPVVKKPAGKGKDCCGSGGGTSVSNPKLGEVLIKRENIITFKEGLLGFEDLREFVILNIEEWLPFEWLVSVENPDVTFPIVNPTPYFNDYHPMQQIEDVSAIGAKDKKGVEPFCIVTLGINAEDATVNLKGPILINTQNKSGKQYVLEGIFSLHHPFVKPPGGKGGKSCCGSDSVKVSSAKLGEHLVKKESIITFKEGLMGFEELRDFVILNIEEWRPFEWLVSVENPDVTFPVVNPAPFFTDYNPAQQLPDISAVGAKDKKSVEVLCTVTLGNKPENATVNLKGPILINPQSRVGKQYAMEGKQYTQNHPFVKKSGKK